MKLLVFAHVPPPHHGQAVMVELMLRGLRGDFLDRINRINRIEGNGGRGSARADDLPQRDAEDTKNVEGCSRTRERLDEKTLDLPKSSDFGYDLPISATEVGHRGTGVPTQGNSPYEQGALDSRPSTLDPIQVFHVNAQVSDD